MLFVAYALSFVKVGIYWSQHHNMLQATKRVNGQVLLANLFLLFWLSLIPFVVRWVGEAGITRDTVLAFGVIMLLCIFSFSMLLWRCSGPTIRRADRQSGAARAQGAITILAYLLAIGIAFLWPYVAVAIYVAVALMWLVPDKSFES